MKKQYFLTLVLSFIFFIPNIKASHIAGGEISWKCLNNGEYVFLMTIYSGCTGPGVPYANKTLDIFGNPLPKDANNKSISSILMKPDSVKWLQKGKGDLHSICSNPNNQFSCFGRDPGVIQAFYYKSDPVTLKGTPPDSGWSFVGSMLCCSPNYENVSTGGARVYIAKMYANQNNSCKTAPPIFTDNLVSFYCLEISQRTLNYIATAKGADSITYHWGNLKNKPRSNPNPVSYFSGYGKNNPLPDTAFDSRNEAAMLGNQSGVIEFTTFSGGPLPKKYEICVRADAWKDGERYASTKRQFPIFIFSCSKLPNNQINQPPVFRYHGQQQKNYEINLKVGEKLTLPIQLNDLDSAANGMQKVRLLSFDNYTLANDRADTAACDNPPCAVFKNNIPQFDSSTSTYYLGDTTQINTTFSWQTVCSHLFPDGSKRTYFFYLFGKDLRCPKPGGVGSYIKVNVQPLAFRGIEHKNDTLMSVDILQNYQWYNCDADSLIPNETNRIFLPTDPGNYAVITTSKNCVDTSDCFYYNPVGIDEKVLQQQLSFYPNPTNGRVTLAFESEMKDFQLKVRNIYGQLVQNEEFANTNKANFTIEGASGIYLIEVIDGKGRKANFKVVKN